MGELEETLVWSFSSWKPKRLDPGIVASFAQLVHSGGVAANIGDGWIDNFEDSFFSAGLYTGCH